MSRPAALRIRGVSIESVAEKDGRSALSTAVLFIGAAAGLAVFFSLIGALVSWGRFYALDLPSDAASASLSQSTLLLRGVNALVGPLLAGLAAVVLSLLLRRSIQAREAVARWASRPAYVTAAVACVLLLTLLAALADYPRIALNVAVGGLLVVGSLAPRFQAFSTTQVAYTIVVTMVGLGVFLLVWGIFRPPTYLERAEVNFANGDPPLHGFWIAGTADTVYVAPRVDGPDGPCQATGEILAFPRDDVARVRFESAVEVWSRDRMPVPAPCG